MIEDLQAIREANHQARLSLKFRAQLVPALQWATDTIDELLQELEKRPAAPVAGKELVVTDKTSGA